LGLILFVITGVVAVSGYVIAGADALSATYMYVVTVFGIGYDEIVPTTSPGLRIFNIFVIISGTSSVIYIVTGLIQMMTHGEIQRALGARRMTRGIEVQEGHVIICGYGRLGQILARDLRSSNFPLVILDENEERIAMAESEGHLVLRGDADEEEALVRAGIKRAKFFATVLPHDADNVFITLTARNLNSGLTIISRGELPSTEQKLMQAGADHVILPPTIGGSRIAELILHPDEGGAGGGNLGEHGLGVEEVVVTSGMGIADKALGDFVGEEGNGFSVVALRRGDGSILKMPGRDRVVGVGDTLVVVCAKGVRPAFGV
jgi:voltage-gated potassium channel